MAAHSVVPVRFLSLMAHLVITIMLFWSREANILACTSPDTSVGSSQYVNRDRELLVAFSLSLACLLVELVGLVTGLSMFSSLTNLFCSVQISDCPTAPTPPINGYICGMNDITSNGQIQLCCENGYRLHGTLTCDRREGKWIGGASCEPVTCPPLSIPFHGSSYPPHCTSSSYTMSCWFSCDSGYQLQGQGLLTCQEDGTWSHLPPKCEPIDCGPPPAGGYLLVKYSTTSYKSTAIYTCKACHKLTNGNMTLDRVCDESGHWSGPLPVCQMVHCSELSSPQYGSKVQTSNACGSQVLFYCMDGYVLLGAEVTICLASGQWSGPVPYCVSAKCPMPVVQDSINFLPPTPSNPPRRNYTYGDQIFIKCQNCRRPVGGSTELTCTQKGHWDGLPPRCEWITCILPKLLQNGQTFPLGNVYFCGTNVRFRCFPGYKLVGVPSTYCSQNGTWTHPFPTCESLNPSKECKEISIINGAVTRTHMGPGGVVSISCDTCYELEGSSLLECTKNGTWNRPIPFCKMRVCPVLAPPINGHIINEVISTSCGAVINFECDYGYMIKGPHSMTCLSNGQWSDSPPLCKAVFCPFPYLDHIGAILCSIVYPDGRKLHFLSHDDNDEGSGDKLLPYEEEYLPFGTRLVYCCDNKGERNSSIECTNDGEWDRPPPKCSIVCELSISSDSSKLDIITPLSHNGVHYTVGSNVRVQCIDEHILIGSSSLTCMNDGHWNYPLPHCISPSCYHKCTPPPIPRNGRLVSINNNSYASFGGISEGSIVIYTCNRGYYIHGSVIRRCMDYGQWNGEMTLCLKTLSPRSNFILRHPVTKQWIHSDRWHYTSVQSIYLACQSTTGIVYPITKVTGLPLDTNNVRVSHFSMANRSHELLLQPLNKIGAHTITGNYQCHVTSNDQRHHIDRIIHVHVHDHTCSFPFSSTNGDMIISGQTPGSCYTFNCRHGYHLHGNGYKTCQADGKWSEGHTPLQCIASRSSNDEI